MNSLSTIAKEFYLNSCQEFFLNTWRTVVLSGVVRMVAGVDLVACTLHASNPYGDSCEPHRLVALAVNV